MILTDEEISKIEDNLKCDLDYNGIKELFSLTESHRLLLSANAELSFKLQKMQDEKNQLREKFLRLQQLRSEEIK